jgi:hypothetical protein
MGEAQDGGMMKEENPKKRKGTEPDSNNTT